MEPLDHLLTDHRFEFRLVTGPADVPVEGPGVALGIDYQVDGGTERHRLAADVTRFGHGSDYVTCSRTAKSVWVGLT